MERPSLFGRMAAKVAQRSAEWCFTSRRLAGSEDPADEADQQDAPAPGERGQRGVEKGPRAG